MDGGLRNVATTVKVLGNVSNVHRFLEKLLSKITSLAVVLIATLAGAANAAPNLLVNGSFEDRVVTVNDTCQGASWCVRSFSSTPGWTQFLDGVDLINNNYASNPGPMVLVNASAGVNFLDMNQANALGGLFQTVAASAGQKFHLSLDTTAWATNARGGTIGYELYDPASSAVLASGSFTDPTGGTWISRTLDATAVSGSLGVRIQGLAATQAGMGLDNVVLMASAVPEPQTAALMLAGLGIMGWMARRHRG